MEGREQRKEVVRGRHTGQSQESRVGQACGDKNQVLCLSVPSSLEIGKLPARVPCLRVPSTLTRVPWSPSSVAWAEPATPRAHGNTHMAHGIAVLYARRGMYPFL